MDLKMGAAAASPAGAGAPKDAVFTDASLDAATAQLLHGWRRGMYACGVPMIIFGIFMLWSWSYVTAILAIATGSLIVSLTASNVGIVERLKEGHGCCVPTHLGGLLVSTIVFSVIEFLTLLSTASVIGAAYRCYTTNSRGVTTFQPHVCSLRGYGIAVGSLGSICALCVLICASVAYARYKALNGLLAGTPLAGKYAPCPGSSGCESGGCCCAPPSPSSSSGCSGCCDPEAAAPSAAGPAPAPAAAAAVPLPFGYAGSAPIPGHALHHPLSSTPYPLPPAHAPPATPIRLQQYHGSGGGAPHGASDTADLQALAAAVAYLNQQLALRQAQAQANGMPV